MLDKSENYTKIREKKYDLWKRGTRDKAVYIYVYKHVRKEIKL